MIHTFPHIERRRVYAINCGYAMGKHNILSAAPTPPFGLLLFVMQGVAPPGTKFIEICLAAVPFMACAMVLVALIIMFPGIVTWLPFLTG